MDDFLRVQQILWLAMISSLFFMGVVAFVVLPTGGEPAPHFMLAVFVGLADRRPGGGPDPARQAAAGGDAAQRRCKRRCPTPRLPAREPRSASWPRPTS